MIHVFIGTKAQLIKMAPVIQTLRKSPSIAVRVIATGQHRELLDDSLREFGIGSDVNLQVMQDNRTLSGLTGRLFPAIADIFEALTAKDRPYKAGKTLSESLEILGRMAVDNHVDSDLFDVFIRERVYLRYAEQFLDPVQINQVDETRIPGYTP